MSVRDNRIYSAVLQFLGNKNGITPETVLYGFAKILLMDEAQIRNLFSEEERKELEGVEAYFAENKLDPDLIRSGLLLVAQWIDKQRKNNGTDKDFSAKLDELGDNAETVRIVECALSSIPEEVKETFRTGKSLDDVFALQKNIKEKLDSMPKQSEEKQQAPEKTGGEAAPKEEKTPPQETAAPAPKTPKSFLGLSQKYYQMGACLLDRIKGQDAAVLKFLQGLYKGDLLSDPALKGVKASFFFFGPSGVGKTYLAVTAAEQMKIPFQQFNMSEYTTAPALDALFGISGGMYNGGGNEGTLTRFVRDNPECVLIFDEIEKAHPNVIQHFLQILGEGALHSPYKGRDLSFRKAILIFTSNLGRSLYDDRRANLAAIPDSVLLDAIRKEEGPYGIPLPPEFCSRISSGQMILFNHLSVRVLAEMARGTINDVVASVAEEYDLSVTYTPELPLLFLFNRGNAIDARVAIGQSDTFIKRELYELTRQTEKLPKSMKKISSISFQIDFKGADDEIQGLFRREEAMTVLVLADGKYREFFGKANGKHKVLFADSAAQAREMMEHDLAAVFVDPYFGLRQNNETTLSIADYNTEGVEFFHSLTESDSGIPVYLLEMEQDFSDVDRRTFCMEGAADTLQVNVANPESFRKLMTQLLEELHMEAQSTVFASRGWVVDYSTRQEVDEAREHVDIVFYGLKKRMAVDVETRGSILSEAERPRTLFSDVIGAENAKEELKYFIGYLKNPRRFKLSGGKPPKGILLYGPPGTGKTMLARAMAGESDVSFFQTSASEFANKYVGESEANIRRLFAKAKKYAPAIIFIDEIDAIGKPRSGSDTNAHRESMLNALLTEMDGFKQDPKKPIFVLAATNFGARGEGGGVGLDEALLRRFDNKIYVDLPKQQERREYIDRKLKEFGAQDIAEEYRNNLAERTTGQSLAILQNVLEMAFRNARRKDQPLQGEDLMNALEEYMYGEKHVYARSYYEHVAIHEAGHAYVSYLGGDKPSYITIESRGDFGGYMQHGSDEDVPNYSKNELLAQIRTSLAGRAAELVFFGQDEAVNTGASSDLRHATELALRMLGSYGMMEDSLVVLSREEMLRSSLADRYLAQANAILKEELANTIHIVEEGKDAIRRCADELLKENFLTGEQFEALMKQE